MFLLSAEPLFKGMPILQCSCCLCIFYPKVRSVKATLACDVVKRCPQGVRKWAPTAIGLAVIPLIVHPIDNSVSWVMDSTIRKWITDDELSPDHDDNSN